MRRAPYGWIAALALIACGGDDAATDEGGSSGASSSSLPGVVWRGGSWEGHGIGTTWENGEFTYLSKYGKTGSRCVYY